VVLDAYVGRGIGTALVRAAFRRAQEDLQQTIFVRTETTNRGARAFYQSLGFEVEGIDTEPVDGTAVEASRWELSRPL
jgi:ribosomal protein S18 acetylase RimI-like enzyme